MTAATPVPPVAASTSPRPLDGIAVATQALAKRYGSRPAVQGLDMTVPRGTVYGFLGPNGSGKTTTLRMLVGLLRPDAGSMWILGQPFDWGDRERLFRVGALIEQPSFYPYLSGRDNLGVFAATGAPTPRHRVEEVLELVGLRERARDKVKTYSLGMRQRLGIAGALLSDPELLLLDEPANGLDPGGIVAMRAMLRALADGGKTVLVSSHILPEVAQLADLVGIIDRGRLVREGPLARLLDESGHVRVRVPVEQVPAAGEVLRRVIGDRPLSGWDGGAPGGWITVGIEPSRAGEVNRALAQAGIYAEALQPGSDLETLFLSLTAAAPDPERRPLGPPSGWGQPAPLPPPGDAPLPRPAGHGEPGPA